jgi:hypothetical protein
MLQSFTIRSESRAGRVGARRRHPTSVICDLISGLLARPGDHSVRAPPDPIPNSAVKPHRAQGTALLRVGERVVARSSQPFTGQRTEAREQRPEPREPGRPPRAARRLPRSRSRRRALAFGTACPGDRRDGLCPGAWPFCSRSADRHDSLRPGPGPRRRAPRFCALTSVL